MQLLAKAHRGVIWRAGLLAALAAGAGAVSAVAQNPVDSEMKKLLHPPSLQSGTTHTTRGPVPETTTPPFTGTIEVTITITLKTPLATGNSIYCTTDIGAGSLDFLTGVFSNYEEKAWSMAKVTGSTATCTVTTPYSWALPKASMDSSLLLTGTYNVLMEASEAETSQSERSSLGSFVSATTIPAAGSTTKYTVAVTL
jgi:hypothetical protein